MNRSDKISYYVLLGITFFGYMGISIPYLLFPMIFSSESCALIPAGFESYRSVILGITLAMFPFGTFLGSPILGGLSDDWGRKKILTTSLWITALSTGLCAYALFSNNILILIFGRFCAGFMDGTISIARAYLADRTDLDKQHSFGKLNAAASIGYFVGPALGVTLSKVPFSENYQLSMPFAFMTVLYIILSASAQVYIKDAKIPEKKERSSILERINVIKKIAYYMRTKTIGSLLLVYCFHMLALDMFFEFGPLYQATVCKLSSTDLVILNCILSTAVACTSGFMVKRLHRFSSVYNQLRFGLALICSNYLLFSISQSIIVFGVVYLTFGFCIGLINTNTTVLLSDTADSSIQGEVLGVQLSIRVLGDTIICLVGGLIYAISPYLLFVGSILLSALAGYILTTRKALISSTTPQASQ